MSRAELISLGFIVGWAWFLMILERIFPYDRRQKLFREGFFTDFVAYTLIQSYVLGVLIQHLIRWIDTSTGWSRLHLVGGWPLWAQIVFFLVLHDFYIYWFHRWQHGNRFLWRLHEAHHSVRNIDWLAGSRSHALEIVINQTIEFAPIVLLGAPPIVALLKGTIDAVWGMYIHSNLNVNSGWLQYVINGPEMHRWHHALELRDRNFATKLAIWDWIFRTGVLPHNKPKAYGIDDDAFPQTSYVKQHLYSFRPFER